MSLLIPDTFPKKSKKKAIEPLAKKYKIMDAFFVDLQKYKKDVQAEAVDELKEENLNKGKKGRWEKERYTHMQHVRTRLEFLEFILSNSAINLTAGQVDILWDCLITNALVPEEREACFAWLEKSRLNKTDGFVVGP